jgi:secreted PhoX family phosphatase
MECEITGPTFTEDGNTLIAAIQHPGELHGTRGQQDVNQPTEEKRRMVLTDPDGQTFTQIRTVPLGSNFPSGKLGDVPKSCVVAIRRTKK